MCAEWLHSNALLHMVGSSCKHCSTACAAVLLRQQHVILMMRVACD